MAVDKKKYFNLPESDRQIHHIREAEKKEKKKAAEKVFDCFNKNGRKSEANK